VPVAVNRARLKSERRQRGWSQDDLAAASGISARTVQRLERGGKATVSSLAALASALAVSAGELTAPTGPVRRITPLTVLVDIAPAVDRFRRMGFGVIETEHAGCVGVAAGNSHHLLCSRAFMDRDWPADIVAPLVGQTISYIWVASLESASQAWDHVVHRIVTDHGTREALVRAVDGYAILAETVN
jgi:transcriptional regulator with XRE-family HTH domain